MSTYTRRTYVCDQELCDAWLEITTKDSVLPSPVVTCPCGRSPFMVSEADATIIPTNEKEQQMENTITKLANDYQVEALEFKPTGETVTHFLTKADINEMFRKRQFLESFLASAERKLAQIQDNLTAQGWYSDSAEKEDILSDLCSILLYEPKQTLVWSATVTVEGTTDVPLNEINDFDLRYFLNDELSVDTNHGDTIINAHYVNDIDSEDWE